MNLIIDIGNSGVKVAFFEGSTLIEACRPGKPEKESFAGIIKTRSFRRAIVSSVSGIPGYITESLSEIIPAFYVLNSGSRLPFPVDYKTPETLGTDRLAGVCGAFKRCGGRDCLVIDAGSALTFDFFTGGRYRGGNISPGTGMRFRALNSFSSALPLVKPTGLFSFPGDTTCSAIEAGVITGILYEINEYIRTFKENHKDSEVFITGGDSSILAEKLEDRNVVSVPWLVPEGLNFILDYNAG